MQEADSSNWRRVLVTAVGTGNYSEVRYKLDDEVSSPNKFSSIALGEILSPHGEPLHVVALWTRGARNNPNSTHYVDYAKAVQAHGWSYQPLDIPEGMSEAELWEIFEKIGHALEVNDSVIVDITHGFRSIPVVMVTALQYYRLNKPLSSLNVYYSAFLPSRPPEEATPVISLDMILALADWTYGAKLFEERLVAAPLADQIEQTQKRSHVDPSWQGQRLTRIKKVSTALKELDRLLHNNLPIEAGIKASELLQRAEEARAEFPSFPPIQDFWEKIERQARNICVGIDPKEKPTYPLTPEELERQLKLIESYKRMGNILSGVTLMREWIVSAYVYALGKGDSWLDYDRTRREAEADLNTFSRCRKNHVPLYFGKHQELMNEIVNAWDSTVKIRNELAHCGMRPEAVSGLELNTDRLETILALIRQADAQTVGEGN